MAHWIIENQGFNGSLYQCSNCRSYWNDLYDDIHKLGIDNFVCPKCGESLNEDETEYVDKPKQKHKSVFITVDSLQEILNKYFDIPNDTYAYNLTRDKSAFGIGTISMEDFEEFNEDTTRDLAEYIIKNF
jgi:hypothetical protein